MVTYVSTTCAIMTPLHKIKTSIYYMHWDSKGMDPACDMAYSGCSYF